MADFLSDDWFDALAERAARATAPADLRLSIAQEITGTDPTRWQVVVVDGAVRIDRNPTAPADVRIVTDRETATDIQAGTVSAQRAFLDGRLRIGGDVQALMDHRDALNGLAVVLT